MRRLSVESTPIRTQVDILTKPVTVEAAGALSKLAGVKGRERFTKTAEIQTQTKTALSKDMQGLLANPNVRRSGCRCPDRYDAEPNPDGPRCKSRFCVRKRAKKEIGKKKAERETRKGLLIKLPERPKPEVKPKEKEGRPLRRAA